MPHPDQPNANMRSTEDPHYKKRRRREIIDVVPRRHDDQPEGRLKSKSKDNGDAAGRTVPFWRDLTAAYEMCQVTIESSRSFRKSDVGRDWLQTIRDRLDWLEEDEKKVMDTAMRMGKKWDCKTPKAEAKPPVPEQGVLTIFPDLRGGVELKAKCRKQEDRIRRLRSKVIEPVVEKPSRATKMYDEELTYDKKVRETLQDAFKKVEKARRAYLKDGGY